jgi:GT2 family glycosyltransferase
MIKTPYFPSIGRSKNIQLSIEGPQSTMTIATTPKVTVIMPTYNCEPYLRQAVDSILAQSFTDFELLIIDDASTDRSVEVARSYRDPRIRIVTNEHNRGVRYTANMGHELARAEYIARMDGDDISLPHRLQLQVDFLDANPHVALVGGQITRIDERGIETDEYRRFLPVDFHSIRVKAGFGSPFANSTVMYRKQIVWGKLKGFNEQTAFAEDYELWLRLLSENFIAHNLPETLIEYRILSTSMMHSAAMTVRDTWMAPIQKAYFQHLFSDCDLEQELVCNFYNHLQGKQLSKREIDRLEAAIDRLHECYIRDRMGGRVTPGFQIHLAREGAYLGYCMLSTSRRKGIAKILRAIGLYPALVKEIPLLKILIRVICGYRGVKLFHAARERVLRSGVLPRRNPAHSNPPRGDRAQPAAKQISSVDRIL